MTALPQPKGYKLLVVLPTQDNKTTGGIILPDQTKDIEKTASIVGQVIAMGETSYADQDKFPFGPYCKPLDWVIFRAYSGTRFKIEGEEYRLINDDSVEAVVADPKLVKRA